MKIFRNFFSYYSRGFFRHSSETHLWFLWGVLFDYFQKLSMSSLIRHRISFRDVFYGSFKEGFRDSSIDFSGRSFRITLWKVFQNYFMDLMVPFDIPSKISARTFLDTGFLRIFSWNSYKNNAMCGDNVRSLVFNMGRYAIAYVYKGQENVMNSSNDISVCKPYCNLTVLYIFFLSSFIDRNVMII